MRDSDSDRHLTLSCPGSKSMTQRALILAALADGPSQIEGALTCDDSRYLSAALGRLGVDVHWDPDRDRVEVTPRGRLAADGPDPLYCGNAGTAVRFGTCLSLVADGPLVIDGDERMAQRPIGDLGDALRSLGVAVEYLGRPGCPPLRLERVTDGTDHVSLPSGTSSQYASGLLMVAPRLPRGLTITLAGNQVSRPYLEMTMAMMRRLEARVQWLDDSRVRAEPGPYRAATIAVEPDWSSAAFLFAAATLVSVPLQIPRLVARAESLQGDAAFGDFLSELRRPRTHHFDLTDTPDLIAPLAAVALFAEPRHPTIIRGARHTRYKECDRINVLATELSKAGAAVVEQEDGLDITPFDPAALPSTAVWLDPSNDHRMAMTFGLLSLRLPTIRVLQRECVAKSLPAFWELLETIRAAAAATAVAPGPTR